MRRIAAITSGLLAIAYIAVRPSPSRGPLPSDFRALAARVAAHPADWLAASALAERAPDAPVRDPLALWRTSGTLAISLAPLLPEPRTSFARGAFFHWNELSAADRKAVLDAYAPVLRDEPTFMEMYNPIYALTGDFDYLRRAAPRTARADYPLLWLASISGRFDHYRSLRDELEKLDPHPSKPPRQPGSDAWIGLCDESLCGPAWRMVEAQHEIAISLKTTSTDEVSPYVEIYVDGARLAEGEVGGARTFVMPVAAGVHLVEIRMINPLTRNRARRSVRITALRAL